MKCICKIHLVTFLYIFLLVHCFKWALIAHIEKCKEFTLSSGSFKCKIHLVTFLYIFLLVDCFKWALIDHIEKYEEFTVSNVLWQSFNCKIHLVNISLYLSISWLFQMSSHWLHWKANEFTLCIWQFQM